jgi:microcystin-dependent protein
MSQPYIGEVRAVGFTFPPVSWATCNGALQSIAENSALFNLIGTTYGGDGVQTFSLPNLQSRIPIHQGTGSNGGSTYVIGQQGGVETVTINMNQFPTHTHPLQGSSTDASSNIPTGNVLGSVSAYANTTPSVTLNNATIGLSGGGSQPHNNIQPYVVLNWIIALYGIYPSQS